MWGIYGMRSCAQNTDADTECRCSLQKRTHNTDAYHSIQIKPKIRKHPIRIVTCSHHSCRYGMQMQNTAEHLKCGCGYGIQMQNAEEHPQYRCIWLNTDQANNTEATNTDVYGCSPAMTTHAAGSIQSFLSEASGEPTKATGKRRQRVNPGQHTAMLMAICAKRVPRRRCRMLSLRSRRCSGTIRWRARRPGSLGCCQTGITSTAPSTSRRIATTPHSHSSRTPPASHPHLTRISPTSHPHLTHISPTSHLHPTRAACAASGDVQLVCAGARLARAALWARALVRSAPPRRLRDTAKASCARWQASARPAGRLPRSLHSCSAGGDAILRRVVGRAVAGRCAEAGGHGERRHAS